MVRKPTVPTVPPRAGGADKALAVRDGLREVRFNVRHGAKKLIEAVEAATHVDAAAVPGPLGSLGRPLNLAVRRAATLLSHVDHAAVDLLAPDADFRAMTVPLRSSSAHFATGASRDLRAFTTDHHWRLRHWLALAGRDDVFVHEQAVALAGAEVGAALHPGAGHGVADRPFDADPADPDPNRRTAALVARALARHEVLSKAALLPGEVGDDDELPGLRACGAVVGVLAGEIAAGLPASVGTRERYLTALRLADEIALADHEAWEAALRPATAPDALGRWFGFVVRHL